MARAASGDGVLTAPNSVFARTTGFFSFLPFLADFPSFASTAALESLVASGAAVASGAGVAAAAFCTGADAGTGVGVLTAGSAPCTAPAAMNAKNGKATIGQRSWRRIPLLI